MRILTITTMYPTPANPTLGTFVGEQVEALRRQPEVERCEVLFIDGVSNRWNYLRALGRYHRLIRREPFDVVLAHYGLAGGLAVTQRRVPVVVNYHGGDLFDRRWQREVSRTAYRLATDAISVSQAGLAVLPGPAHQVTCGIDLELFTPRDRAAARGRFGVQPGELALLFPSSPKRAVKMYPRFQTVAEELGRRGHRVHELRLEDLARAEVPEIMAAADVMVMTSRYEATPVAIMEALACGLPVVAPPIGEIPAMLDGVSAAHVLQFDVEAFSGAVEALLQTSGGERRSHPSAARFDENELARRVVEILAAAARR